MGDEGARESVDHHLSGGCHAEAIIIDYQRLFAASHAAVTIGRVTVLATSD